ncbi:peptidoglycan DD-metalloendopeptidase family protein [Morganella psychrotolerans]|uniref:Peptidoglycan DD-metalloendopeptidase family protein n=1 Tax=Morganella psychrotolerans TaxID=368603 RepID=A0A5M9RAK0_9GAMM|nr:peptidoglycan DD-metalloendopeptidase family protein [Morganella psychrotolerans]KAA8717232.1 peptidoglycan DD-metalloendopeptidase family protein [Morganella psychrotolerans]OBU08476.1 hypothetical protein AYY16_03990 [Morganella psychrotolerans]
MKKLTAAVLFAPVFVLLSACTTPVEKNTLTGCDAATAAKTTGQFQWPLKGNIVDNFTSLKAITIAVEKGKPVLSAADGDVVYVGNALKGYGNLIIISHDEVYRTAYGHNDKILVKEGDKVKTGQQIATVGDTDAKQPLLHFEVRKNGNAVDPCLYLAK